MSEDENVKVVQGLFEAFGRGDVPAMLEGLSDDVSWRILGTAGVPYYGEHTGRAGVTDFFGKLGSNVEFEHFEPREFISQGDKVVVLGGERGRVKPTGRGFEQEWAMVFTVSGGKIKSFRCYEDTEAVSGAFRPQE